METNPPTPHPLPGHVDSLLGAAGAGATIDVATCSLLAFLIFLKQARATGAAPFLGSPPRSKKRLRGRSAQHRSSFFRLFSSIGRRGQELQGAGTLLGTSLEKYTSGITCRNTGTKDGFSNKGVRCSSILTNLSFSYSLHVNLIMIKP